MFKDIEVAREADSSYREMLANEQKKPAIDFNATVLSMGAWPTYPDVAVEVPRDIQLASHDFEQRYKSLHSGHKLTWKHILARCLLKAAFPKGSKDLIVSAFQAIVLLCFNDCPSEEHVSYSHIQEATKLPDEELKRTLQSLACARYRVLTKHPRGRDVASTDTFTVNLSFSDPKLRIKINQIQLKETKEENKATHERVAADRQYETQAAIVRIMKSEKVIKHAVLMTEVIAATRSRGTLEPQDIKKQIEKLIDKDYMRRGEDNTYSYLA
jgi:nuclear pore complex protein Nup205